MGTHVEPLDRRPAIPLPSAALAALSDVALARRVIGGQERPFELLYDRYKHPLYRYCAAFLRHPEDAEDALQAAMVNAFRALARGVAGELAVRPWLYRIAYRECLNVLSRRAGHQELTGAEVAPGASVAERAEHSEQVRQLAADLADLAPRARQALLLRELAGLSHTEIGIALDTSPSVARNLVYEARLALEDVVEGRGLVCEEVLRTLSNDGRAIRGRRVTAHLRACVGCRAYRGRLAQRPKLMSAMLPAALPVIAARRILETGTGSLGSVGGGALAGSGAAVCVSAAVSASSSVGVGIVSVKGMIAAVAVLVGTGTVAAPLTMRHLPSGSAAMTASVSRVPGAAAPSGLPAGLTALLAGQPISHDGPAGVPALLLPTPGISHGAGETGPGAEPARHVDAQHQGTHTALTGGSVAAGASGAGTAAAHGVSQAQGEADQAAPGHAAGAATKTAKEKGAAGPAAQSEQGQAQAAVARLNEKVGGNPAAQSAQGQAQAAAARSRDESAARPARPDVAGRPQTAPGRDAAPPGQAQPETGRSAGPDAAPVEVHAAKAQQDGPSGPGAAGHAAGGGANPAGASASQAAAEPAMTASGSKTPEDGSPPASEASLAPDSQPTSAPAAKDPAVTGAPDSANEAEGKAGFRGQPSHGERPAPQSADRPSAPESSQSSA